MIQLLSINIHFLGILKIFQFMYIYNLHTTTLLLLHHPYMHAIFLLKDIIFEKIFTLCCLSIINSHSKFLPYYKTVHLKKDFNNFFSLFIFYLSPRPFFPILPHYHLNWQIVEYRQTILYLNGKIVDKYKNK